jgi:hypothetical protein
MRQPFILTAAILLTATTANAEPPAPQFEWLLQVEGDGTALASSFLPAGKKFDVPLTPALTAEWTCRVSEVSVVKDVVQRSLYCWRNEPNNPTLAMMASKVACRTDGQPSAASAAFLMVSAQTPKKDGTLESHRMDLVLTCAKK